MKPIPPAPTFGNLFERQDLGKIALAAQALDDGPYLHWDKLRHLPPPAGLDSTEWWLALKFKRSGSRLLFPGLQTSNGTALSVTRHARVEAATARLERALAGKVLLPEAARNASTRDQFIASSLMEEAIHSSLFEGAVSTREVAKDMLRSQRAPIGRDERMILNNYQAMVRLKEMAQSPLTAAAVLELHHLMTEGTLDKPGEAGRMRRPGDERVTIVDNRLQRVVFSPPPAEQLEERLQRLVAFANADDITDGQYVHPVLRSILLHFQFAYDHPFHDGNGRTARALFYWSMLRRGDWMAECFSISRPLYQHRQPYERAYLEVESDEQDGTYFVLQQLDVLERAVEELFAYVGRKSLAQRQLRLRLHGRGDLNHRQLALLDHAIRHPDAIYTHESHGSSHRMSLMTARADLLDLVGRGWLQQSRSGKRHVYQPVPGLEARLFQGNS